MEKRKNISLSDKEVIWSKTGGRCHICGRVLVFNAARAQRGRWNVDHVVPIKKGGKHAIQNFLPICRVCNRLKWHFKGRRMRELIQFGVIAWKQYEYRTELGKGIKRIYQHKLIQNKNKHKGKLPDWYYR